MKVFKSDLCNIYYTNKKDEYILSQIQQDCTLMPLYNNMNKHVGEFIKVKRRNKKVEIVKYISRDLKSLYYHLKYMRLIPFKQVNDRNIYIGD